MKRYISLTIAIVFIAAICSAGEFRKWGVEDIEWGYGTVTSAGGVTSTKVNFGSIPGFYVNVKSDPYNATGDGTTDDTAAIKAAIDNVTTTGGTVYFPAGTYKVTDGIYIRGNVNLVGEGSTSRIVQTGTSFATTTVLFYYQSPTATTLTASGALSAGDTTLTVNSAAGLTAGQEVFLQLGEAKYDATQPYVSMFNTIASIDGSNVTFRVPFPEDINGTSHNCLTLTRIVQGVTISNLSIEASATATPDQAMYIERCRNVKVENIMMNHTGGLINSQSENVSFENIYSKRARYYAPYAASGRFINGFGFRNFLIKNVFVEDSDETGIFFEAEGRGASIENFVYNVGPGRTSSGYGLLVQGDCKGIYLKNAHFNAPYSNFYAIRAEEDSEIRTEDVFIYNGTLAEGFLKNHRGMLGYDRATGTMEYYSKIKQYSRKVTLDNSMNTTYTLPSGLYKQVRAYISDATGLTYFYMMYGSNVSAGEFSSSLVAGTMVDLSTLALTSFGPDASYPFNNNLAKQFRLVTSTVTTGAYFVINAEYYSIDDDAAQGMIQE